VKTIWTILSIVAVANLLALGGFVGWLAGTDRLDASRARAVREMFSITRAEQAKREEEARAAEEAARAQAEAEARAGRAPLTAAEKLAARGESTELDVQRAERLRREIADLRAQLARDISDLERQRADLQQREQAFASLVESGRAKLEDEQFQKTLGVLSALKPAQAVTMLRVMLSPEQGAGYSESGMVTVVSYLDAMEDKVRTKIIGELANDDPGLATQLLERLRTRAAFAPVRTR
jgi:hypothetical protein